jgi:hypothetical protein
LSGTPCVPSSSCRQMQKHGWLTGRSCQLAEKSPLLGGGRKQKMEKQDRQSRTNAPVLTEARFPSGERRTNFGNRI